MYDVRACVCVWDLPQKKGSEVPKLWHGVVYLFDAIEY